MMEQPKKMCILICFILSVNAVQNLYAQDKKGVILNEEQALLLDSISQNPSGKIYFFDGKEISEPDFYVKIFTQELRGMTASIVEGKKAVIRFGERYRDGIVFGESEHKNETEADPKTQNEIQDESEK